MEKFVVPIAKKPYEETEQWQQRRCSEFRKHPGSVGYYGIIAHYGILGLEQVPLYFFPVQKNIVLVESQQVCTARLTPR